MPAKCRPHIAATARAALRRWARQVLWLSVLGLVSPTVLAGCDDTAEAQGPAAPRIFEVRPERAEPGAVVALLGAHFGLKGPQDGVFLGGVSLSVESWTDDTVLARLPLSPVGSRVGVGTFDLVVRAGALVSQPFAFEVRAATPVFDLGPFDEALFDGGP